MLYGRADELRRIDALIEAARGGRGGALTMIGDPGTGKSALLDHAAGLLDDKPLVLRCAGVESEAELPFAGLQLLLQPVLPRIADLPEPHRNTLRCAFGLAARPTRDRFAVGMATLALLAELSADSPLLCLIDDAQWLDRPSVDALVFAAYRIGAEAAVLLFAARPEFTTPLTRVRLGPLDAEQSRALLGARFPELTPELRDRVLAEAAGNPLAVLELPRMDLDALPVEPLQLPERLCSGYRDHIAAQPESARLALLVAAAEDTGDVTVVRRALRQLGLDDEALVLAEKSCMVVVSAQRVTFRHPLKRTAAYQLAPFTQRQAVHAALAEVTTDDPDRRAWHLAAATSSPDETIAAALEATAERAALRTAYGAAATAFERSARLTPDRTARARRLIRAVAALTDAGRPEQALAVADTIDPTVLSAAESAHVRELRAHIAFEFGALTQAYDLSFEAATQWTASQPDRAALALLDAARTAWTAGDLPGVLRARQRISELPLGDSLAPLLAALDGPTQLVTGDKKSGIALIRACVASGRTAPDPTTRFTVALLASIAADLDEAQQLLADLTTEFTTLGMIGRLPAVHASLGTMRLLQGRFRDAEATCLDAIRMAECTGQPNRILQAESILAVLAAIRGEEDRCRELTDRQLRRPPHDVNTIDAAHCEWALLLLELAQGRYEAAVYRGEALERSPHRPPGQWPHLYADRVEAAVRWRQPERAVEPLAELTELAAATGNSWVQGLAVRGRALVDGDGAAFEEALRLHGDRCFDRARTELLYGEWLRRERRVLEARTRLGAAAATFERLAARPWAERAHSELRAAGGDSVSGDGGAMAAEIDAVHSLTPQEFQVVRLAAQGATNNEIGAQLCLSPKTVGHHLYRAFPKLGVRSRIELVRLVAAETW